MQRKLNTFKVELEKILGVLRAEEMDVIKDFDSANFRRMEQEDVK